MERLLPVIILPLVLLFVNRTSCKSKASAKARNMDQVWHVGEKLQKDLLAFHLACASFPAGRIGEAKRHFEPTVTTLREVLKRAGVALNVEYTGSAYEGIKVPSTDVEFDVMVVLTGGKNVKADSLGPLYTKLYSDSDDAGLSKIKSAQSRYLDPGKMPEYFNGKLQKAINEYPNLNRIITLRRHGPAVQMDVYKRPDKREIFYSVDMVPAYDIPGGGFYVAKPFKDEQFGDNQSAMKWRKSFSLAEKSLLGDIDRHNQCRKQCMRILKVLRDSEPGLHHLNSYFIKTAILTLTRDQPGLDWSQKNLGQRLMDILKFLCRAFEQGRLQHYFIGGFNMLTGMSPAHRENIMYRLKELVRSEENFNRALRTARAHQESSSHVPQFGHMEL